jgi:hypothetical protein
LAFTDLTRRNEHYQRRHWSIAIATSKDGETAIILAKNKFAFRDVS